MKDTRYQDMIAKAALVVPEEKLFSLYVPPTQEDLQNMLNMNNDIPGLVKLFYYGVQRLQDLLQIPKGEPFPTFEMMWLAIVMKEKYHKKWNCETKEWVDIPFSGFRDVGVDEFFAGIPTS